MIRERAATSWTGCRVGETFDWVQHVSIELTIQMLATLIEFPLDDRHVGLLVGYHDA